ncbi:MAG: beta-ketoacyl-ACP synthase 3 [Chloroflexi bacterium]|nr:beta-ketoacyl-ACP synthase 3 [Chloroflexota bacterium]
MSKVIIGTGHDLPEWVISNDDLEAMGVDFDRAKAGKSLDEWAMAHAGIHVRHRVRPGEGTSDMGARAARRAVEDAGLQLSDIGLIVVSTFTSDYRAPNTGGLIQAELGMTCKVFQVDSACSGFIDATLMAASLMDYMSVKYALVISSDAVSQYNVPTDFRQQTLFADGSGAVVLKNEPDSPYGLKAFHAVGDGKNRLVGVAMGGKVPLTEENLRAGKQYIHWRPREVYPFATAKMAESAQIVVERAGWKMEDVRWFVPHQTGRNIILDMARVLNVPEDRVLINIDHTGNTSGASIPICLDEFNRKGVFKDGDKIVMPTMGAGMAWGALAFVWQDYKAL